MEWLAFGKVQDQPGNHLAVKGYQTQAEEIPRSVKDFGLQHAGHDSDARWIA